MECKGCGVEVHTIDGKLKPVEDRLYHKKLMDNGEEFVVPFYCEECGAIKLGMHPVIDRVFIYWYTRDKTDSGLLYIPDCCKKLGKYFSNDMGLPLGVIVAKGGGFITDDGVSIRLNGVDIGNWILGDKRVPNLIDAEGNDGKLYQVSMIGFLDIKAAIDMDNV